MVRVYQVTLSPALSAVAGTRCRFYPSCSHYALQCLEKHPAPKALYLVSGRLLKCGPWHPGGIDLP